MKRSASAYLTFASWLFTFAPGCSGSGNDVVCGPGTVLDASTCFAQHEGDGGGDAQKSEDGAAIDGAVEGGKPAGPTFAGVTSVAPAAATALQMTWAPAEDTITPSSMITYDVYLATAAGKENFSAPTTTTPPGATSIVIDSLQANTQYFVVVRAVNAAGVEDKNTTEGSGTTQLDITAPTFAGATLAGPGAQGSLVISWASATDNLTPKQGIDYLVYLATTAGGEDLTTPDYVSDFGATGITIPGLTLGSTYYAIVRARDASGNIDSNTREVSGTPGADPVPPLFAGCTAAIAEDATSVLVTWNLATDSTTPQAEIAYDVFASTTPGEENFSAPTTTFTGVSMGLVTGLSQKTTYYFVCRARDTDGTEDKNTSERIATTPADTTPPSFAGLTAISEVTASSVELQWLPATDIETPIVYLVYEATSSGGENYSAAPTKTTAAGATSVTISGLVSSSTYYFVVRAEDAAGNIDDNTLELSASTSVSFSTDVQAVFSLHCAVPMCHVANGTPGGPILIPSLAYSKIVNVSSTECPEPPAVLPAYCSEAYDLVLPSSTVNSYLYLKITSSTPPAGTVMPPVTTGDTLSSAEISTIMTWIQGGALNN
jgi:chitodextrinase